VTRSGAFFPEDKSLFQLQKEVTSFLPPPSKAAGSLEPSLVFSFTSFFDRDPLVLAGREAFLSKIFFPPFGGTGACLSFSPRQGVFLQLPFLSRNRAVCVLGSDSSFPSFHPAG